MGDIEQVLSWWTTLSREDKARWLQCAATPEEIDADLRSPDPAVRAAAGIASVGDAWTAFRTSTHTTNESEHAATNAAAGLSWWNSMTEPERAQALKAAGWKSGGTYTPSAADAWDAFKHRARMAAATRKPLRYIVLLGRDGQPPHLFDTKTKTKIMSYPTVAEAERQAILLNKFIRPELAP